MLESLVMSLKKVFFQVVCLPALVLLTGCKQEAESPVSGHAAYYWSTVFKLSDVQRSFIRDHTIQRLYVRYFDVVMGQEGEPMPNATIQFKDTFPQNLEIVPTVFILNECMAQETSGLAHKIAARILQMNETHDVKGVSELQIDSDWTITPRRNFFAFLDELRPLAKAKGIALSATIRLHQLSQPVPPVDRGVLMVYNTGDVTRFDCHHPILDLNDVRQYLRHLKNYDLPLSAAYPLFSWRVLFRNGRYVGIMHGDDLPVIDGDSIALRQPDMPHIMEAREAIGRLRSDIHHEVILYDISEQNITRFKTNDYETIFGN